MTSRTVEPVPQEWLDELHGFPEGSPEHAAFLGALGDLGLSVSGYKPEEGQLDLERPFLPPGFREATQIQIAFPAKQFEQRGLNANLFVGCNERLAMEAVELMSDQGNKVRVVDLRPITRLSKSIVPETEREQGKLDKSFWSDVKLYADQRAMRYRVSAVMVAGVGYTRAGTTSMRAYWMLIETDRDSDSQSVRTIARIGDSGNNKGRESRLYRNLFNGRL